MIKDLKDQKFGRLTVVSFFGVRKESAMWNCRCSCGNELVVRSSSLRTGNTASCGCLHRDTAAKQGKFNKTHGQTETRLYKIWDGIKKRCYNPNVKSWKRYGGRGITLTEDWLEFESFKSWAETSGYAANLSIDRIDNNLGYCPENCRWATARDQSRNRNNCIRIWYKNSLRLLTEVAEDMGIKRDVLYWRFKRAGRDPMFLLGNGDLGV